MDLPAPHPGGKVESEISLICPGSQTIGTVILDAPLVGTVARSSFLTVSPNNSGKAHRLHHTITEQDLPTRILDFQSGTTSYPLTPVQLKL